jgi:uncharacterized phiE125 gp8 family phage protein
MATKYKVVTPPSIEPVTLDEAKRHARVFVQDGDEDAYIGGLIKAAREYLEAKVCRSFISQSIDATLDGFPSTKHGDDPSIKLLYPPLQSITSISYVDPDGNSQTLDSSKYVAAAGTPGLVTPASGTCWPSTSDRPGSVTIRFVAGYGDEPADVPEVAKLCIKILAAGYYDRREPVSDVALSPVPFLVESLSASLWWGSYP